MPSAKTEISPLVPRRCARKRRTARASLFDASGDVDDGVGGDPSEVNSSCRSLIEGSKRRNDPAGGAHLRENLPDPLPPEGRECNVDVK